MISKCTAETWQQWALSINYCVSSIIIVIYNDMLHDLIIIPNSTPEFPKIICSSANVTCIKPWQWTQILVRIQFILDQKFHLYSDLDWFRVPHHFLVPVIFKQLVAIVSKIIVRGRSLYWKGEMAYLIPSDTKKRKVDSENSIFKDEWTEKYTFVVNHFQLWI